MAIVLVLNKVDRLIIELKLPPADAYFKLLHTIGEVNAIIDTHTPSDQKKQRLSPELGNVCFASGQHGWSFTLESFAQIYAETYPGVPSATLAARFWGDKYYNPQTRTFTKNSVRLTLSELCRTVVRLFFMYILLMDGVLVAISWCVEVVHPVCSGATVQNVLESA